ncbi:dynein regulatory complex subunit 5-like [Tubulanus polymorphus]|uniref:dynein regulatory complex subunit 5-like n=1 Tax=Tubulanus polymorphus TaxID=672921 RepID=UPI003DA648B0
MVPKPAETDSPIPDGKSEAGSQAAGEDDSKSVKSGKNVASRALSGKSGRSSATSKTVTPEPSVDGDALLDLRNMRRIIAEDPEWSLATVPLLGELCVKHIVGNFEFNSKIINDLLPKHKAKVLDKIAVGIPLKVTAQLVEDEGYWKRCCKSRWEICDVSRYGASWKRMYFERNLEEIIEHFVPEQTDPTKLQETLPLSTNFVQRLIVRQLLPPVKECKDVDDEGSDAGSDAGEGPETDHFDFSNVLPALPNLVEFRVTYGVRDCGMNFEWNLFQFTAKDCLLLAKCIANCKNLKVFQLHRSKVDDDKVRVLISHILDHPGLVELDLSHNMIGDRGARAIGKFLNNRSKLVKLDISDNQIRAQGAQAIAHALMKNTTLTSLNVRLNRLADEGGAAICRALLKNSTLVEINLGSNEMTEPTAAMLSQVVGKNSTLTTLDLSCNRLGPDGGKQLQEDMADNKTIVHMDLRLTECGQESEYIINQRLSANRDLARERELDDD